ncbi:hypothetical protein [Glaciibacter sp. 2TAF33]|uniref:hypothetical protein n=1 Tax=Glaciibacter sp. 2TAF33 TaxID=3233015 RepID=UPI003F8E55FB
MSTSPTAAPPRRRLRLIPATGNATPTPIATDAAGVDPRHPSSCAEIYTTDWAAQLSPLLVLNPAWTQDPAGGAIRYRGEDDGLETVLEATTSVTCIWAKASGGGDVGLTTNVAEITETQQASVTERMSGLGYSCFEEIKGLRCVTEVTADGSSWGESHFLREGLWFATKWVNTSPEGYTHDIVGTVFGDA